MRLIVIRKPSAKIIEILGVHEIGEKDGTYYITGEYDPRTMTIGLLTVMHGETILFKTSKIELDDRLYYSIEVSK